MEKNKKIVAVSLDRSLLEKIAQEHAESGIKSRSAYIEGLIRSSLEGGPEDGKEEKPADISGR